MTIFNDKIYQLTWQAGIGFVYDLATFEQEKHSNTDRAKRVGTFAQR